MDEQLIKISSVMQKVEQLVYDETKDDPDDFMLACSALMAVTRNMYIQSLGVEDTAKMFNAVADSVNITEGLLNSIRDQHKPTIH
tara:strand:+ start:623 stop:877 length:255 start_codon:yes stop_codon:yes gene_type:complete